MKPAYKCDGVKLRFSDEQSARETMARLMKHVKMIREPGHKKLVVYFCHACNAWHMGHPVKGMVRRREK